MTQDGRLVGLLTRHDLLAGVRESGPPSRVADAMQRDFLVVDPNEMLDVALGRLDARQLSTAAVAQNGRLIGLLTAEAVGEFLNLHASWNGSSDNSPEANHHRRQDDEQYGNDDDPRGRTETES